MTLVERLHEMADWLTGEDDTTDLLVEAANRIEELEQTIRASCQGLTHCMGRFGVCVCGSR